MARIFNDVSETVGGTPLVRINRLARGAHASILAKLESFNPGSSLKDRTGLAIIDAAERDGRLEAGGTILEATSGNTGIALAWVGAVRGYRVVIVMPDDVSRERRSLLRALGAEVRLTPGADGMAGANARAAELLSEHGDWFLSGQGGNAANPAVHERTTGPEIWADTDGEVDILVAATGTGGTLSGAGRYLRRQKPEIAVYGVEPAEAPVLNGGQWSPHRIQGITGGNGRPPVTDLEVIDEVLLVSSDVAIETAREAMRREGLIVGISSGAVLAAALRLAAREENAGRLIVAVLADTGERYISSELFDHTRVD